MGWHWDPREAGWRDLPEAVIRRAEQPRPRSRREWRQERNGV